MQRDVSPPIPSEQFDVGDRVIDRDDDDPETAIVVETPTKRAGNVQVPGPDQTVAEYNPEYPADDPVVYVVFERCLEIEIPNWQSVTQLAEAVESLHITRYAYPESRLNHSEPARLWINTVMPASDQTGPTAYGVVYDVAHEPKKETQHGVLTEEGLTHERGICKLVRKCLQYLDDEYPQVERVEIRSCSDAMEALSTGGSKDGSVTLLDDEWVKEEEEKFATVQYTHISKYKNSHAAALARAARDTLLSSKS